MNSYRQPMKLISHLAKDNVFQFRKNKHKQQCNFRF